MSQHNEIKRKLKTTPFLVADVETGEIQLIGRSAMTRIRNESGPFPTHCILDLAGALDDFAELDGIGSDDREFLLKDIAKVAGMSYSLAYHYVRRGVFVPSIREASGSGRGDVEARFSWRDAFIAATVGCLRRHGVKLEALKAVRQLFADTKKRTAERAGTR